MLRSPGTGSCKPEALSCQLSFCSQTCWCLLQPARGALALVWVTARWLQQQRGLQTAVSGGQGSLLLLRGMFWLRCSSGAPRTLHRRVQGLGGAGIAVRCVFLQKLSGCVGVTKAA